MENNIIFLSLLFVGLLHMSYAQRSNESVEDDGEVYNYDYEESLEYNQGGENSTGTPSTISFPATQTAEKTTPVTTEAPYVYHTTPVQIPIYNKEKDQQNKEDWIHWTREQVEQRMLSEWWNSVRPFETNYEFKLLCYNLAHSFRAATSDMRRYYKVRVLYENNAEYEIGIVTQEIIYRYSHALELYHQARRLYVGHEDRNFAPVRYMFYMYMNLIEECHHIIHLCNMMHEIESKYVGYRGKSLFKKSNYTKTTKSQKAIADDIINEILKREQQRQDAYGKKKKKQRKKHAKKVIVDWQSSSTKRPRSYKYPWPIVYGWSIEDW